MLIDIIVYRLFRLVIVLGRPFPTTIGYFFARMVAMICYPFYRGVRRSLYLNLSHVLGTRNPAEIEPVARRSFRNFSKYVVDFVHFYTMTPEEIRRRTVFNDFDRLNAALAEGKGVIFVTLHFGNWDMGAASLAAFGYPVAVIAETFRYDRMNHLVQGSRKQLGMKIIPMEKVGPGIIRSLHRGEMLALLIDIPALGNGVAVEFFGAPCEVPSGPARIALHSGARVVPAALVRIKGHDQLIQPVLDFDLRYEETGDEEADVRNLTQRIMWSLERVVRQHPDQWFIFRPMWSAPVAVPEGEPLLVSEP